MKIIFHFKKELRNNIEQQLSLRFDLYHNALPFANQKINLQYSVLLAAKHE